MLKIQMARRFQWLFCTETGSKSNYLADVFMWISESIMYIYRKNSRAMFNTIDWFLKVPTLRGNWWPYTSRKYSKCMWSGEDKEDKTNWLFYWIFERNFWTNKMGSHSFFAIAKLILLLHKYLKTQRPQAESWL